MLHITCWWTHVRGPRGAGGGGGVSRVSPVFYLRMFPRRQLVCRFVAHPGSQTAAAGIGSFPQCTRGRRRGRQRERLERREGKRRETTMTRDTQGENDVVGSGVFRGKSLCCGRWCFCASITVLKYVFDESATFNISVAGSPQYNLLN